MTLINEFLKTYKDGGMVYLDPTERDRIVEEINRLKRIDESHQRLNGELREEINKYDLLIFEIRRYLNCYQYFLETQEENNKKLANMIHEFETKDSVKK
jgi:hypothetical protein